MDCMNWAEQEHTQAVKQAELTRDRTQAFRLVTGCGDIMDQPRKISNGDVTNIWLSAGN